MPIEYEKSTGMINIHNDNISYVIQILKNRYPVHQYFGKYIQNFQHGYDLPMGNRSFTPTVSEDFPYSATSLPLEYSTIGTGDYRIPGYLITDDYGQLLPILEFTGLTITDKPVNPAELPQTVATDAKVSTLTLHLKDALTQLEMDLNYTIFEKIDLILRSTTLKNSGTSVLAVSNATSAQMNFVGSDYQLLSLSGTHAHEANPVLSTLHRGIQLQHTFRGTSGPQQQPFVALSKPNTNEFSGNVCGLALVWSGNFETATEVDQYDQTRLQIGVEPTTFKWQLNPGASFQTPETAITWSDQGFNGMSQNFHNFGEQLLTHPSIKKIVPINTWESMTFHVSATKVSQFINDAHKLKANLVVLDDGWFNNRNDESGQLGDWIVDREKFPEGLKPLVKQAHDLQMKFGLWVEPEMVSQNSQLYHEHPDWALNYRQRQPITARHQLDLDLSQSVVQEHLIKTITKLVQTNHLDYLKWDMNRHLTQVGNDFLPASQQNEIYFRYVLGLYHVLKSIRTACPDLIIENCSAGGGRLDFGMLSLTDFTWLSDLTDPIDRLQIEQGFSLLFPHRVFSNHVSKSPNDQNGRITSIDTRLKAATIGRFGFELDPGSLSNAEIEQSQKMIEQYQTDLQPIFNDANFYRLSGLDQSDKFIWLLVSKDKAEALLFYCNKLASAVKRNVTVPLHYLKNEYLYDTENLTDVSGQELNRVGISIAPSKADFEIECIRIKRVKR